MTTRVTGSFSFLPVPAVVDKPQDQPDEATLSMGNRSDGLIMSEALHRTAIDNLEDTSFGPGCGVGGLVENAAFGGCHSVIGGCSSHPHSHGSSLPGQLDGKISEELWDRKSSEWQSEEQQLLSSVQSIQQPPRFFGLKMVLSNRCIDSVSLYPNYRKPFDLIFQMGKTKEWCAQGDDLRTFVREFVSSFQRFGRPLELGL